jgi:ComF family protein
MQTYPHQQFQFDLMRWPRVSNALRPNMLTRLHAIGHYQQPLKSWVRQLKFNHKLLYADALAQAFCATLAKRSDPLPDILIPAPLHINRYATRHFNQAAEIAQSIGLLTGQKVDSKCLHRKDPTTAQSRLKRAGRIDNVQSAFSACKLETDTQHVAIVDDALTTGATMQAMIDALVRVNSDVKVEAWVMAIALPSVD